MLRLENVERKQNVRQSVVIKIFRHLANRLSSLLIGFLVCDVTMKPKIPGVNRNACLKFKAVSRITAKLYTPPLNESRKL